MTDKKTGRKRHGTATIHDVARVAGVSLMTVSRVINGEPKVRATTRTMVLDVIRRLNYAPNAAARNLATGTPTHIGLLYANPSAAYLSQFLVGALESARRASCHLVLEACESESAEEQAEAAREFAKFGVDGVILPPPLSESTSIRDELKAAGIRVVTVAMGATEADSLNVRIDDHGAAAAMTRHLVELGHRDIGFVRGHPNHVASYERERGFLEVLEAAGVNTADLGIEQGYFTYRSGLVAAQRLLARKPRPTAIFASNDDMAAAAVNVAHRMGLFVPEDLTVVGFDDTSPATTIWPELTTVRQPIAAMASAAMDLLLAELRARKPRKREEVTERILDYELVLRQSSTQAAR